MKKLLLVLVILSTMLSEAAFADRSGSYAGRGAARTSRRASGISGSKDFCFPVGNCVDHRFYEDKLGFLGHNPYKSGKHLGEDWNFYKGGDSDFGHPVYTVGAGVVTLADNKYKGWGKCVIILHTLPDGSQVTSLYAHLEKILVKKNDVVALHQQIGTIGDAEKVYEGFSHLHFEIRKGGKETSEPGYGYSSSPVVQNKYLDPTAFIKARLPPLYTQRPKQNCIGALKKAGGIYSCTKTPKGGIVGKGETLSPLVTIDNVWVDHRFAVTVIHNKKVVVSEQVSAMQKVDTEYGWSTTQMVKQIKNAEPGEWRFIYELRYNYDGVKFESESLGEIVYQVNSKAQSGGKEEKSIPWFLFKSAEVCKKFGGGKHTDWVYNCIDPKDVYQEGESFYVLVGIMNVMFDHRFVIDSSLDGVHKWTFKSDWNIVKSGTMWKHAYFWPKMSNAEAGTWSFIFHLEFKDKSMSPIVKKTVVVKEKKTKTEEKVIEKKPEEKLPEKVPENKPQEKPEEKKQEKKLNQKTPYTYSHTDICTSIGGPDKDWKYWCVGKKTTFPIGTTKVHVLSKLTDIWVDHRFRIKVYKGSTYLWEWQTKWSDVDPKYGWKYSHFFPYIGNLSSGNWKVKIYVGTDNSEKLVAEKTFTILGSAPKPTKPTPTPVPKPAPKPEPPKDTPSEVKSLFEFKSAKACTSVSGGSDTDWKYTCHGEKKTFKVGETAYLLAHFVDLKANHRFKVLARKNNMFKWSYVTGWNHVLSGWKAAYFFPQHKNLTFGNWEYEFYIQTAGVSPFEYVKSVKIFVSD